jgi:hypothetical protein
LLSTVSTRYPHLWALLAPLGVGLIAWIIGMLMFDALGAGYLKSLFVRAGHLEPERAAWLVRVTARASAVIVAANLIATTHRARAVATPGLRTADLATFAAFLASHTVHFVCVVLLARATAGENIRNAGGWLSVVVTAIVFYIGAAVVLRAKQRPAGWRTKKELFAESSLLLVVWIVFFQAYALRSLKSPLFAALAVLLAYSVAGLVRAALRSRATLTFT